LPIGKILTLKWDYVDFQHGLLNLPDSKTGEKSVLLASPALQILAELPCLGIYVISGQQPDRPRADLHRPWRRLTAHAGLNGLCIHDFRQSFASVGAESGMGLLNVGKLLGHADQTMTLRYAPLAETPLRRAAETVAGTIASAIGPAKAVHATAMRCRKCLKCDCQATPQKKCESPKKFFATGKCV
jgi:integrase